MLHSKKATGAQFGLISSVIVATAGVCIVSFDASWKLSLAMFATVPMLFFAGTFYNLFLGGGTFGPDRGSAGQVSQMKHNYNFSSHFLPADLFQEI